MNFGQVLKSPASAFGAAALAKRRNAKHHSASQNETMKTLTLLTLASALAFIPLANAEERPDHFKGKPAPTLEAALANLTEYNAKLAALLKKERLAPADLLEVHQLSYTLEQALEKLGQEQARLAALLEEVHLASERGDSKTVKASGRAYLKGAAPLAR